MGIVMERLLPGLIIAGAAAFIGSGVKPEFTKPTDIEPNTGYSSGIIQRDAPIVPDNEIKTSTHRGFTPAQDAVCEHK
jgi:hypothetical protein